MPRSESGRRWLKFLVALGVSVAFSYLFIRSIDVDDVLDALRGANYWYVAPALALFAASLVARSLRWQVLYGPSNELSWRQLMPSLLVGYAGNNLLPLRAGELLRAQHLAEQYGVARMETFGTLMMERLFDSAVLATFVLWGLLLVDAGAAYLGLGLALAGLSVAGFAGCTLLTLDPALPRKVSMWRLPFATPAIREHIANLGGSFLSGFTVLRSPSRFGLAVVTSVVAWGLELGMYYLVAAAFDLKASLITIAFAGSAANVAMSLPSAQGGVGPFQFFATEALLKFEVAKTAAAAYALALHIFLVAPVSLGGLIVLWRSTLPGSRRARVVEGVVERRV
jgi:uncharacterized protein (TIRG00374 family)